MFFHVIDEGQVVLRSKGVFRQGRVYRRGSGVYASWGGGFIRLVGKGGTSLPNSSWLELEAEGVTVGSAGPPKYDACAPADEVPA